MTAHWPRTVGQQGYTAEVYNPTRRPRAEKRDSRRGFRVLLHSMDAQMENYGHSSHVLRMMVSQ